MTLTEQWKKGELDRGIYYIKEQDSYKTDEWHGNCWEDSWSENVEEVLAPVPSYEELEELKIDNHNLKAWIKNFQPKYKEMEKENQYLKTQIAKLTEIVGVLPSNHSVGNLGYKIKNQRHEINIRLNEIDKLKELLKECRDFFYENLIDTEFHFSCGLGSDIKKQSCIRSLSKLKTKIDEVLK